MHLAFALCTSKNWSSNDLRGFITGQHVHKWPKWWITSWAHCCSYYHVCDQLVSQQNTMLQVEATCCAECNRVLLSATNFSFAPCVATDALTCLNKFEFNACYLLSRSAATWQIGKKTWWTLKNRLNSKQTSNSRKVISLPSTKTSRAIIVFGIFKTSNKNKANGLELKCSKTTSFRLHIWNESELHTDRTSLARKIGKKMTARRRSGSSSKR